MFKILFNLIGSFHKTCHFSKSNRPLSDDKKLGKFVRLQLKQKC